MNAVITAQESSETTETDKTSTEKKIVQDIECIFKKHMYKMHTSTKAQILYNLCNTSDGLFKGKVCQAMVNNVLTGKFADIFKPWRVLQAINSTSGGTVNFSGIDSLRDALREDNPTEESNTIIDKKGNKRKRRRTFLLPSSFKFKECSK